MAEAEITLSETKILLMDSVNTLAAAVVDETLIATSSSAMVASPNFAALTTMTSNDPTISPEFTFWASASTSDEVSED